MDSLEAMQLGLLRDDEAQYYADESVAVERTSGIVSCMISWCTRNDQYTIVYTNTHIV